MKKLHIRIITAILALLMAFSVFSGALAMIAHADDDSAGDELYLHKIITADTTVTPTLTVGRVTSGVTITFSFLPDQIPPPTDTGGYIEFDRLSMPADSSFGWTSKTRLRIETIRKSGEISYYRATLRNATYTGGASRRLELYIDDIYTFSVPISSKYFREASDGDGTPVSDIVVEDVKLKNAAGKTLESVTGDTTPFTVEITYYDTGLKHESRASLTESDIYAFTTAATGFKTLSGTVGEVEVLNSGAEFPRFKAVFKDIKSDGTTNAFPFRIQYSLRDFEKDVKGEATAVLYQIDAENTEGGALLKPNLIVRSFDYGDETIVAGDEFNLELEFLNTSESAEVENVIMTIIPGSGFTIAASSNTVYVPSLLPGDAQPYSVALLAAPSSNDNTAGTQTDYSVTVKFEYQYLSGKQYETGANEVKIAVPVIQLDRFSIDEITDYTPYLTAGEEGYITVPIINKGKSPTYNISAEVKGPEGADFSAPMVHYGGQLDASKTGNIDISITINTPGEFTGEVIVMYEDENMNQKQIATPFSIMVSEPYIPMPEMPGEIPEEPGSGGMRPINIILIALGAVMVAVPTGLFFVKRAKARGNEDIDESF